VRLSLPQMPCRTPGRSTDSEVQSSICKASNLLKQSRPIVEPIEPHVFIAGVMMVFMSDMQLAQLALIRGTSDSVRAIAMHLIDDCNRVLLDITRVATRKNLQLPRSLDQEHEDTLQHVREKTGAVFDSAFIERIALHHHAITLFNRGQAIKVPEISALASRLLAVIEARARLGRQLSGGDDSMLDGGGLPQSESIKRADLLRPRSWRR
jgi:predicted outer membrane protein